MGMVLGNIKIFLGNVFGRNLESVFGKIFLGMPLERTAMRKKSYKGRCEKKSLSKCNEICRTYGEIQNKYADMLQSNEEVKEIKCNVLLDGLEEGEYTSDFVCVKADGDLMVRECVERKFLTKPMTVKLIDASRRYWLRHGVSDWGLVIDAEKK
jgi:hypothetical protein